MVGPLAPPSPRSVKRKMMLITLAGTLALVGAVSGAYYFAMRPVTLRIAVGPQSSDDLKVVQTLTQSFAHSPVRLRALQRLELKLADGAVEECAARFEGYVDAAGELQALPSGASLDAAGTFYWQPGPAFHGTYRLLFVRTACDGTRTRLPVTVQIR